MRRAKLPTGTASSPPRRQPPPITMGTPCPAGEHGAGREEVSAKCRRIAYMLHTDAGTMGSRDTLRSKVTQRLQWCVGLEMALWRGRREIWLTGYGRHAAGSKRRYTTTLLDERRQLNSRASAQFHHLDWEATGHRDPGAGVNAIGGLFLYMFHKRTGMTSSLLSIAMV
ncbi:hypothetical protein DPEC_G00103000 [Dallia pectoralis]|uniref:Uncharacterized protein n=1 Tax=Dallia pectoralis TaxID=75939 RepID=A0ACC2GXM5_DALPE|nr:hypothetical protein DPEC_G00103000 [Dallia pectoralis]